MRLVDDRVITVRDHFAVGALAHRGIRAQQVVIDDHHVGLGSLLPHLRDVAVAILRTIVAEAGFRQRRHVVPQRRVFLDLADLGAVAGLGAAPPLVDRRDEVHRRGRMRAQLIETMQAQVVGPALHVGRGEGHPKRGAQRRNVLEVDLFLEVLRSRRNQHALPVEDRRDQVRERLAGAGACFGEQDAAVSERPGHRAGHRSLALTRLELFDRLRERPVVRKRRLDGGRQARRSG